ncbi:MAG: tRNA 4-thiouridine(8) synthase ThiI [Bacilli bacterium]|nr:tRNA 4-thiouridine(8) synthase ThiI [Bacilli bacterium]
MKKLILIKYGELSTKKGNIKMFINKLYQNINDKLKGEQFHIKKDLNRIYLILEKANEEIVINKLKEIFGIHKIVIAYKIDSDFDTIKEKVLTLCKKYSFQTFKVETKRANKNFPINSMEVNKLIGAYILQNISNIKVNVHQPDLLLKIEIRDNGTYIYTDEISGLGGYPVGIQGKGLLMLSGGIDSPVAGFLSIKRGISIDCIYFESPPHTSIEAKEKVIKLAQILNQYDGNINLHIVPFTKIQEAIYKNIDPSYIITIMRRMMYRISAQLLEKINGYALINGESIGQVASQTLTSMVAINSVTNIPVIRPVACFDKLEIINLAKKIGTYDTSILPYEDCCTIFVPEHPVINPNTKKCNDLELNFDYQKLINECLSNIETINIKALTVNDYQDLL